MSFRRRLDWTAALHDLSAARVRLSFAKLDGRFDLAAIMRTAAAKARRTRANVGGRLSWQACMRLELRQVWADAKRQRAGFAPHSGGARAPVLAQGSTVVVPPSPAAHARTFRPYPLFAALIAASEVRGLSR